MGVKNEQRWLGYIGDFNGRNWEFFFQEKSWTIKKASLKNKLQSPSDSSYQHGRQPNPSELLLPLTGEALKQKKAFYLDSYDDALSAGLCLVFNLLHDLDSILGG